MSARSKMIINARVLTLGEEEQLEKNRLKMDVIVDSRVFLTLIMEKIVTLLWGIWGFQSGC